MTEASRTTRLPDVDPGQAAELLERGEAVLLDVREPQEWAAGHAPQAEHLPL
ncbi:rhodanese-like domain-containing protein, partial [Blastococcus sp. MG754426]|nr:rhodanese-like domain-containing protein [Blastococcus sp. MG754426]MCF6514547.1 rhodanese-like domain-containing protein [Blastococcus sp. MG754427]